MYIHIYQNDIIMVVIYCYLQTGDGEILKFYLILASL